MHIHQQIRHVSRARKQPTHGPTEKQAGSGESQAKHESETALSDIVPGPLPGPGPALLGLPWGPRKEIADGLVLEADLLQLKKLNPLLVHEQVRGLSEYQSDHSFLLRVGFLRRFLGLSRPLLRQTQRSQQLVFALLLLWFLALASSVTNQRIIVTLLIDYQSKSFLLGIPRC